MIEGVVYTGIPIFPVFPVAVQLGKNLVDGNSHAAACGDMGGITAFIVGFKGRYIKGEAGNGVGNPIGGIGIYTEQVACKTALVGGKRKGVSAVSVGGQGHCSGSVESLRNIVAEAENLIILHYTFRLHSGRIAYYHFSGKYIC